MKCPNCGCQQLKPISELFTYGVEEAESVGDWMETELNYRCKNCEKEYIVNKRFIYYSIEFTDIMKE